MTIRADVLLENTSDSPGLSAGHGLSLLIRRGTFVLLLDTGPDESFMANAGKLGLDLSGVRHVALSHAHNDHTGGVNAFAAKYPEAVFYLGDRVNARYYSRRPGPVDVSIGMELDPAFTARFREVPAEAEIAEGVWMIKTTESDGFRSSCNANLLMERGSGPVPDTFEHERSLVLEDRDEVVLFNSCSHRGPSNIIRTVMKRFPGRKVRAYVGGLHLSSRGKPEPAENLDRLCGELERLEVPIYTGHCTGAEAFEHLKRRLGGMVNPIRTGMRLEL